MNADSKEAAFQQDIIDQMVAGGWKLGEPAKYDRKLALYTDDQLQDTIYRFEHADGVVGRINRDEGQGHERDDPLHNRRG